MRAESSLPYVALEPLAHSCSCMPAYNSSGRYLPGATAEGARAYLRRRRGRRGGVRRAATARSAASWRVANLKKGWWSADVRLGRWQPASLVTLHWGGAPAKFRSFWHVDAASGDPSAPHVDPFSQWQAGGDWTMRLQPHPPAETYKSIGIKLADPVRATRRTARNFSATRRTSAQLCCGWRNSAALFSDGPPIHRLPQVRIPSISCAISDPLPQPPAPPFPPPPPPICSGGVRVRGDRARAGRRLAAARHLSAAASSSTGRGAAVAFSLSRLGRPARTDREGDQRARGLRRA